MIKSDLQTQPPNRELLNDLYVFLKDLGMTKEIDNIPKPKIQDKLLHIFHILVTNNKFFPAEAEVHTMLHAFFQAVIYGDAELKWRNTKGLIDAFRQWASKPHLRGAFTVVKQIPPTKELPIEEWDDQRIQTTLNLMSKLGLLGRESDGFYFKITQEGIKRGMI